MKRSLILLVALVLLPLARATNDACSQEDSKDDCRSIEGCFWLYGDRRCVPEDEVECEDIPRRGNCRDLERCEWRDNTCVDRTPAPTEPPSAPPSRAPTADPPKCRGDCTFRNEATIKVNERGVSVTLARGTRATGQCLALFRGIAIDRPDANTNNGAGRVTFRDAIDDSKFRLTGAVVREALMQNNVTSDGFVSGSPLPNNLRVEVHPPGNPTHIRGFELVQDPQQPGPRPGDVVLKDIFLALKTECRCRENPFYRNISELVVRIRLLRRGVLHNADGVRRVRDCLILIWNQVETCNKNRMNCDVFNMLKRRPGRNYRGPAERDPLPPIA